jgi:hypothetical protein
LGVCMGRRWEQQEADERFLAQQRKIIFEQSKEFKDMIKTERELEEEAFKSVDNDRTNEDYQGFDKEEE